MATKINQSLDLEGTGLSADVVNKLSLSEAKALEKALGVLDASNVTLAQLQRLGSSAPGLQEAFIRSRRAKDNAYNLLHTAAGQTTLNQVALTAPDATVSVAAYAVRGARTGAHGLTNGLASAGCHWRAASGKCRRGVVIDQLASSLEEGACRCLKPCPSAGLRA